MWNAQGERQCLDSAESMDGECITAATLRMQAFAVGPQSNVLKDLMATERHARLANLVTQMLLRQAHALLAHQQTPLPAHATLATQDQERRAAPLAVEAFALETRSACVASSRCSTLARGALYVMILGMIWMLQSCADSLDLECLVGLHIGRAPKAAAVEASGWTMWNAQGERQRLNSAASMDGECITAATLMMQAFAVNQIL